MAVSRGLLLLLLAIPSMAVTPTPVEDLKAFDTPGDDGSSLLLTWKAMPYDGSAGSQYVVEAAEKGHPFQEYLRFDTGTAWADDIDLPFWMWSKGKDRHALEVKFIGGAPITPYVIDEEREERVLDEKTHKPIPRRFVFRVTAVTYEGRAVSAEVEATPEENWFKWKEMNNLVLLVLFSGIVFFFIRLARRNPNLFLRRIAGLDAVDEAIGRATEMGKPLYYVMGLYSMDAIQNIASTMILGRVAAKVAEYDSLLRVPHRDPVVFSVCQEVVREAYIKAGRPDAYKDDINFFLTSDQFSYTASVDGMIVRERPAAIFYMGYYLAESLLLAEVGATTGAIQVAGTDVPSQLPFFVTACDYTLIGEELYAASAYLSKEPVLVGTLRGQDMGKMFTLAALVISIAFALLKLPTILDLVKDFS